ncbi:hypothetical protein [Halodesulfovibrio aestuarii]|uniref:hypothetical protein n=1 Tax=Halodesulfovibrio aestuarii TaxID=126333 RepID=UPI0004092E5A
MLDSLVGTILTDVRTVLEDLDPFLLELEVSAERADAALLSTIYNTTPLLSNCFNLLGLTDAVALVDLLQLVTGAFRKHVLSLSYVHIREVIRGFSALVAFLENADAEKISIAIDALKQLVEEAWPAESKTMLASHSLRDPLGHVAFSILGYVLQDDFMHECTCFVLELDDSGVLAGTQFTPFSLLQFLYKSGQVLDVQFAPPESEAYLQVLFATVLDEEQLQMVLDIPADAIHVVSTSSFGSKSPAWDVTARTDAFSGADGMHHNAIEEVDKSSVGAGTSEVGDSVDGCLYEDAKGQNVSASSGVVEDSYQQSEYAPHAFSSNSSAADKFALLEAELEGELFEEALSAGIAAQSFDKAKQEVAEKAEATPSCRSDISSDEKQTPARIPDDLLSEIRQEPVRQTKELHGFVYESDHNNVSLYVSKVENAVEAEQLRAALLELLSSHADVELVLRTPIRGNLELLQLLLAAAMTAGLRRQNFRVSGEGRESVAELLASCGITFDVLKAQGLADFLG